MSGSCRGACFADFGHDVVCIDKDQGKIDRLHAGIMPIYEPGLEALVDNNVKAGRLAFTTSLAEGIRGADAIFIAVGHPEPPRRWPCRSHLCPRGRARSDWREPCQ